MKSLDTNILFYAINSDCAEYQKCRSFVDEALKERDTWIIADQLWFELYRLLRNSVVLEKPLSAADAASAIEWYREKSGWLQCSWEPDLMDEMYGLWNDEAFAARNCFDLRLALILKSHGVTDFYTRNVEDFKRFDYFKVINPLD